jgi:SAM-dependent methyltransferase
MSDSTAGLDLSSPNAARMYDYYLGGASNFAVDREAAERFLQVVPTARQWAYANRGFLVRAVRYMAESGIDQFLDLGSGIPTAEHVHEIARRTHPHARVAYVDNEPVAVIHAERLLDGVEGVTITQADMREPGEVLSAPGVAELLDFTRPVGVLAVAILHFVGDGAQEILRGYRAACAPGSYLAVSHLSRVDLTDEQMTGGHAVYNRSTTPATFRTRDQITDLFAGYEVVAPGVVLLPDWHPDTPVSPETAAATNTYAGVGLLSGA